MIHLAVLGLTLMIAGCAASSPQRTVGPPAYEQHRHLRHREVPRKEDEGKLDDAIDRASHAVDRMMDELQSLYPKRPDMW